MTMFWKMMMSDIIQSEMLLTVLFYNSILQLNHTNVCTAFVCGWCD